MKDYIISDDLFFKNNGFSCKYFLEHFKYFINNKSPHIKYTLFRKKAVFTSAKNNINLTIKPHFNDTTSKYITILNNKKILAIIKNDITPLSLTLFINSIFNTYNL